MLKRLLHVSLVVVFASAGAPLCFAQVDLSSLTGTVSDSAGQRIPAAHVVAVQVGTGLKRGTVSSASGAYEIPDLPIGLYRVTCSAAGFQDAVFELQQTVGQTRTLNLALGVAGVAQRVEVSGAASQLDQTSDALGASTEPEQVKQLPLNGRNWSTLTALVPGAVDTGGSNQRSIRFAGRGLDDNNYTFDGIDATNIVNQAQQPFVRIAIPTDAIAEFRVDTMLFTAENGSTPGGQIAVVSKSGSNQLHGSVFEYLRNDVFDAREPADNLNGSKPPFRLNQFGGEVGGPIVRDRTFYFFDYAGIRQTLGQTLLGFVPSASFRAQVAAAEPVLIPILNAYPVGQLPVAGNAQEAEFVGSGRQLDHEDSAMLRMDQRFSNTDSAYLRFSFDAAASDAPFQEGQNYLNDKQQITSRPVNGELEYLHIFSPRLVNEAKFGFNRGNVYTTNQSALGLPTAIAVSGYTTLSNNEYKIGVGNDFSEIDDLTMVRGNHTLKFGAEVRRIQLNQGNTANGTVTYASTAGFLANAVSSASYASPLPVNGLRKTEVYSYAEDEWKLKPNLTFNLGLRYSFFNLFHEVFGKAIPFDFATCGPQGFCAAGASFGRINALDFDPRVSLAWAPRAFGGRTIFRSGFGIYHGDGQLDDQNLPISNEVGQYSLSAVSFPIAPYLNGPGTVSARDDDRNRKDSYVSQWGFSVQQALAHNFVNTLSYVGSKGTDLLTTSYVNLKNLATGLRPYPAFGQVQWRGNINNSSYQGLVESLQRNFTHGLLFNANYTWSHQIDQDSPGGGDADYPQNPACLPCERASGDYDVRSVFTSNLVYDLPVGPGQALLANPGTGFGRAASAVLGRWTVSPIVTARTGLPVNVTEDRSSSQVATGYTTNQRPNRVPGVSLVPPGGRKLSQWINPAAFALVTNAGYGDAPRNIARGPGLWQADLGMSKHIPVTERVQIQFRSEFFNLFNRAQYGPPLADFSTSTFGEIQSTVNTGPVGTGTPRQIQFALRAEF